MTLNKFRILCAKFFTDNLSDEEQKLFELQIEQSKKFREEFESSKKTWENSKINFAEQDSSMDVDWAKLELKLSFSNLNLEKRTLSYFMVKVWKPVTATIALSLLILTMFLVIEQSPNNITKTNIVSTNNGEQKSITLPDSSIVTLNSASSIEYLGNFGEDTREIKLQGEAFFIVRKEKRPFIVLTHNANTKVLGTEFNVRARGGDTEVIVREGLVNLASKTLHEQNVNISKEFSSLVTVANLITNPKRVETKKLLSWLEGKLFFEQTTLLEITKELERFYDLKVYLKSEMLNEKSMTGSFSRTNIDSTLTMICLTLNLEFEKNKKGYLIKEK